MPLRDVLMLPLVLGTFAGLAGVALHRVLSLAVALTFGVEQYSFVEAALRLPWYVTVAMPALGGFLVGLLVWYTKESAITGEGVPEVQRLLATGGAVSWSVAPLKALTTTITIASGGSVGREGPIIQIGAVIGAVYAKARHLRREHTRTAIVATAAGAMAATFGAPAAAVVFAFEVLEPKLNRFRFLLTVLTVAVAVLVARGGFGFAGLRLSVTAETASLGVMILAAVCLGVVAGGVAFVFTRLLGTLRHGFGRLAVWHPLKPALGGFLVGCCALATPFLYEPATATLFTAVTGTLTFSMTTLVILLVLKITATAMSLGSGASGGVFAPSLVIGLLLGALTNLFLGTIGFAATTWLPLMGMAAVFSALAYAPLTASIILFEITGAGQVFPFALLSSVVAFLTAYLLKSKSLYRL